VGATVRPEAAPAPTGPQATQQVTGQVFPEVTRLVSRGDGTQRITLKLSPEALGEVRVVLTVRDGDVQVRMIGSELAQQALRAGAPELQRLLDLAGATSSSVIVGDQGSAPEADLHSGTDRNPDHRTAGTRDGDTSARDGSPGGPQQRPSSDPTATRGGTSTGMAAPSGVDMTM
jgi:flagellar hook-length control protein FliK